MSNPITITKRYVGQGASSVYSVTGGSAIGGDNTGTYSLTPATDTILGGIIVGSGLTITTGGTLSVSGTPLTVLGIPLDNQVVIWKDNKTIEGDTGLTFTVGVLSGQVHNTLKITGATYISLSKNAWPGNVEDGFAALNVNGGIFTTGDMLVPYGFGKLKLGNLVAPDALTYNLYSVGISGHYGGVIDYYKNLYFRSSSTGDGQYTTQILFTSGGSAGFGFTPTFHAGDTGFEYPDIQSKVAINGGLHIGGTSDAGDKNLLVDNMINTDKQYNIGTFTSGFFGSGYRLRYSGGTSSLEIDDLIVRRKLSAYELEIRELNSVGGSLVLSPGNCTVYDIQGTHYIVDSDNNRNPIQLQNDDIIRAQIWTGRGIDYWIGKVTSVVQSGTLGNAYFTADTLSGDTLWVGAKIVVVGNTTQTDRQNLLYLTAADTDNPYISGHQGVSGTTWEGTERFRLGNLNGVLDPSFGELSGFGLWSDNIYLHGHLQISSGSGGYSNLNDKPTSLSGINSTEGSKLTGIEDGATVGADWDTNIANKPTSLGDINSAEGTKLTGVQAGATVGADWSTNITNRPSYIGTPTGTGLWLSDQAVGYYTGGQWTTYMDSGGSFSLGNTNTGAGISWNQQTTSLIVRGNFTVDAGTTGGWSIANDAIYVGTKKTSAGYTTDGITLAANGSIRSTNFEIGTDGRAKFTAVDSQLATLAYADGTLNGSLSHTQYYSAATNHIERVTHSGYPYDADIYINGTAYTAYWNTDEAQTMSDFYNNWGYSIPNVTMTHNYGDAYIDFTATNGEFSQSPGGTYFSESTIQAYAAGVNPIDTITLTGSEGRCEILVNNYDEGAFGVNGVTVRWMGSLGDTAVWFVNVYGSHYAAQGVTVTRSGNDLIFEKSGAAFLGTNAVRHHTEAFLGNIKLEGNEIWEDSMDSDTDSVLKINYHSYGGGDARNRVTMIGGGNGATVVNVSGQDLSGLPAGLQVKLGCISFPRHSVASRNALSPMPGSVVFIDAGNGADSNKLQVYISPAAGWVNLN